MSKKVATVWERFSQIKKEKTNKRIAIYGVGRDTEIILKNISRDAIVCVMDAQKEGTTFMGCPVYSVQQAKNCVDVVVIVAREGVIPIIYERIKELEEVGIQIVDIEGQTISADYSLDQLEQTGYLDKSLEQLKGEIDAHEVISFDVFDTLIMRKILRPADLFSVIAKRVEHELQQPIDYIKYRLESEKLVGESKPFATLANIYQEFGNRTKLSVETVDRIKQLELDTERKFLCPRKRMGEALNYALDHKKKVYLISDMYLPGEVLRGMLDANGIVGYDKLFVSCDEHANKWPNGDLFKHVLQKCRINSGQILHIGDNPSGDIECAKKHGIDTYHIWSAYEMCVNTELKGLLVNARTTEDYVLVGIVLSQVCNNPFAFTEHNILEGLKSGQVDICSNLVWEEYRRLITYPKAKQRISDDLFLKSRGRRDRGTTK